MNNAPVLACEDLQQSFFEAGGQLTIFENISLNLQISETLAITGASGSGKSTLLYLLGGLEKPRKGLVKVCGQDLATLSDNQLAAFRNQHLGFVYQFHHLLAEFSALENVAMPLLIRGLSVTKAREQAVDILQRVGLSHREHHKPSELSGGERQRTAIARALVTKPRCLLADEPTGNLDNQTAAQVIDLLMELNQQLNTAMIVVTHDLLIARRMQRHLILEDGRLRTA